MSELFKDGPESLRLAAEAGGMCRDSDHGMPVEDWMLDEARHAALAAYAREMESAVGEISALGDVWVKRDAVEQRNRAVIGWLTAPIPEHTRSDSAVLEELRENVRRAIALLSGREGA